MNKQARFFLLFAFILCFGRGAFADPVTSGVDTTPVASDVVGLVRPGDTTHRKLQVQNMPCGFNVGNQITKSGCKLDLTMPADVTITSAIAYNSANYTGGYVKYTGSTDGIFYSSSASTTGYGLGWAETFENLSGHDWVWTPIGSLVNGAASFDIPDHTACYIRSDNNNFLIDFAGCSALGVNAAVAYNVLPATNGGAGTVNGILYASGSGLVAPVTIGSNLTFSGGTLSGNTVAPAGSDTQVQYNNNGTRAGASGLLYTSSTSTLSMGGPITWQSGLGAINHIVGPLAQTLAITAGTPASATAGNSISFTATNAGSADFGHAYAGGGFTFTAGNATYNSQNSGQPGGSFTLTSGNAASYAAGGGYTWTGGTGGSLSSSQNGAGGSLSLTAGTGATGLATGYTAGTGGNVTITAGAGGSTASTSHSGGTGGAYSITTGAGGASSGNGGSAGVSGALTIATGSGGTASGTTSTGGNSGAITIKTGAPGSGTSTNGTAGTIELKINSAHSLYIDSSGNIEIGGNSPQAAFDINTGALLVRGGTAPTINSCGSSPSIAGSKSSFLLTMGSGTLTTCTVNDAFTTAPNACELTPANSTAAATGTVGAYVSAISTSSITITGLNLTSAAYYVHCF